MATYVLVHGAFHGGWCWRRVEPLLRARGHEVFTPTLTGLGERSHLGRPETDLATHVRDVIGTLTFEELRNVILVGHSYGGMVVTGVAGMAADRLSHLVYLDAFVPEPGQKLADLIEPAASAAIADSARTQGDGWHVPPFPVERFGIFAEDDVRFVGPRLVGHPLQTFLTPVEVTHPGFASLPRTYVYCDKPAMGFFEASAAKAKDRGWRYHVLGTGHDAMVTAPAEVARLLLELV
jgi:pimeloyl-ACP methyl ester carboxylesterase